MSETEQPTLGQVMYAVAHHLARDGDRDGPWPRWERMPVEERWSYEVQAQALRSEVLRRAVAHLEQRVASVPADVPVQSRAWAAAMVAELREYAEEQQP